jgi:hypothetical protein
MAADSDPDAGTDPPLQRMMMMGFKIENTLNEAGLRAFS